MADDLNSVNIEPGASAKQAYHHGDLRAALIAAAEAVIAERGVDGFSLREAARRAGVSAAAPGHHFGDARGLLTAVATAAFRDFGDALEAGEGGGEGGGGREARIRGQGLAYVRFALAHPAQFDLMWRHALIDPTDPDYEAAGRRAFSLLDRAVRGKMGTVTFTVPGDSDSNCPHPSDPAAAASLACWSLVHGFARLARDGVFGTDPGAAERATEALLPLVLDHLDV